MRLSLKDSRLTGAVGVAMAATLTDGIVHGFTWRTVRLPSLIPLALVLAIVLDPVVRWLEDLRTKPP